MDFFKYATQKGELSYSDIAKGDKIVEILERAKYIFGFTDDKTDITEIYLFKKSLKCFYSSKNLLLNWKLKETLYKGLEVTMWANLILQYAKNRFK